jgi:hypothetical protein
LIQRDNTLDVLKYSGVSSLTATDPLDLPSWIPNWQSTPEAINLNLEAYCAARQTKAMIRFSSQRLLAHGVLHGRICYLEPIIPVLPTKSQLPSIFRTWSYNDLKTGPPVTFGIPRLQQYFRTIFHDYNFIAQKRLSPDNESFYGHLTAFIYCCIILYKDSDPSSEFVTWLRHIDQQSRSGCIDREDLSPFLSNIKSEMEINWCGGVKTVREGARQSIPTIMKMLERREMNFILVEKHSMGLAPRGTEVGDIICVLLGHSVPIVLRPKGDYYSYVGQCFAYGLIDGEAVQEFLYGNAVLTEFTIS